MLIREFIGALWPEDRDQRVFGIEIEVEGWEGIDTGPLEQLDSVGWRLIEDGSLRGGMEFVFRGPRTWTESLTALTVFYQHAEAHGWTSNIRTSMHVHVNMLHRSQEEVGAILAAHGIIEPLLFEYCGPLREQNIYCVPWYRGNSEYRIAKAVATDRLSPLREACKYSALYLEPLLRFGTLEFRHAPFFEDQAQAMQWFGIIDTLCTNAAEKYGTADAVVQACEEAGVNQFLIDLLGHNHAQALRDRCAASPEAIVDYYDTLMLAEKLASSLCTYKVNSWKAPQLECGSVDNVRGYRNLHIRRAHRRMYELEPDLGYDEYPDDEEYYEEDF